METRVLAAAALLAGGIITATDSPAQAVGLVNASRILRPCGREWSRGTESVAHSSLLPGSLGHGCQVSDVAARAGAGPIRTATRQKANPSKIIRDRPTMRLTFPPRARKATRPRGRQ